MLRPFFALTTLALTLTASAAPEGETKRLSIGDPAPPLAVKWIKGEPIAALGNGSVTVVDFWATWCGPCRASIPHMSEIQKQYADQKVNVVGVSVWEKSPSAVAPFVQERDQNETAGDEMDYRVAMDDVPPLPSGVKEGSRDAASHASKGKMAETWMQAAELQGIPSVFIVDRQGMIAWIGHPMNGMDEALAQIAGGTWNIEEAKASAAKEAKAEAVLAEIQAKLSQGDIDEALDLAREHVGSTLADHPQGLNGIAWIIVDPSRKDGKIEKDDLELARSAAERANELTKGQDPSVLDTLARVHFVSGDVKRAAELQRAAVELTKGDAREALERTLAEYEQALAKK
jgi:thiol-disulfide isomerase/thioredoxin